MFPKDAQYYFVKPDIPRGMDVGTLRELALQQGVDGTVHGSVKEGLEAAMAQAEEGDMVFVGGSTFVVAEVV